MKKLINPNLHISTLQEAKLLHAFLIKTSYNCLQESLYLPLQNKLLTAYTKNNSIPDAEKFLQQTPRSDTVSWNILISASIKTNKSLEAFSLLKTLIKKSPFIYPDEFTFSSVIKACESLKPLQELHTQVIFRGYQSDHFICNVLIHIYAKFGKINLARQVFDKMPERNIVSHTSMILGYGKNRLVTKAEELFDEMVYKDKFAWNGMLAIYTENGIMDKASRLFSEMPREFLKGDVTAWNSMILGYVRCGFVKEGLEILRRMPNPNVVSWNHLISGFASNGYHYESLECFRKMIRSSSSVRPDEKTLSIALRSCGRLCGFEQGRQIHAYVVLLGLKRNVFLCSGVLNVYAKCGFMRDAEKVFDRINNPDMVCWTTLVSGYAQNGYMEKALWYFEKMAIRDSMSWNALISGYAKKGMIAESIEIFEKMPCKNIVSWNAIIAGCSQSANAKMATDFFQEMLICGVMPDEETLVGVLPSLSNLCDLARGEEVHGEIVRRGFHLSVYLGSGLVDLYSKCGNIDRAIHVFLKMARHNVVCWNVLIGGYAKNGLGLDALKAFEDMKKSGIAPDSNTFVGLLSACCNSGLLDEGQEVFDSMIECYRIVPTHEHYACMVQLLGRNGQLNKASGIVSEMKSKPSSSVWMCLLDSCADH